MVVSYRGWFTEAGNIVVAPEVTSSHDAGIGACRFASFFPSMLHMPVDMIAFICSKICRLSHAAPAETKPLIVGMPQYVVGADTPDAAR